MMGKSSSTSVLILMVLMMSQILMTACTNVWGGVNSDFLYALNATDRKAHLRAMQENALKVLRILFVRVDAGAKGSSSVAVSELEPDTVGVYANDVLNQIDTLMFEVVQYEVKLLIALHDRYSLGCWRSDAYVTKYNITDATSNCDTTLNNPVIFYTNVEAQADFDRRLEHILTHQNPLFGNRTWGEISEAVFGFEPESEAQGFMSNPDWNWTCRRAVTMRQYISNGILIVTGGGVDIPTSVVDDHFKCSNIDVVSIHDFRSSATSFNSSLATAKSKALEHGKRIIVEIFGSRGNDTEKSSYLRSAIDAIAGSGIPWLPWEFLTPGNDKDFEFGIGSKAWSDVACRGKIALTLSDAFSWPEISSLGGNATACTNPILEGGVVEVWGGVNSHFLYALNTTDRLAHLNAMETNNLKVARILIVGVDAGAKGSSSVALSELEPDTVGLYDDDVLNQIDTLMFEATQYGVKLLITLHDRYSLGCRRRDAYVTKYNIRDVSPNCNTTLNNPAVFYTDAEAQADFDRRIEHILTHQNPHFGNRTWGEIHEAVFGFEPENEAQGFMSNPDWNWACRRSVTMRQYISNGILIVTGGGVDIPTSVVDNHFKCSSIDVVSIHDLSSSATTLFSSNLATSKSKALENGKRIIMEIFGSTGNDSQKSSYLSSAINVIEGSGIPWLPWEFVSPGNDQDYEFGLGSEAWSQVACRGKFALALSGAFSWPEISSTGRNVTACTNPNIIALQQTGLAKLLIGKEATVITLKVGECITKVVSTATRTTFSIWTPSPAPLHSPPSTFSTAIPVPSLPYSTHKASSISTGTIAGVSVAAGIILLGLVICLLFYCRSKKDGVATTQGLGQGHDFKPLFSPTTVFSYEDLRKATQDFHPDNKLGEGGFGPVYKGRLADDQEVAIKKLSTASHQGKHEFMNEVSIITSVQHRNLIKLYGCCAEGSEKLLVYEYLPNKSLDLSLFNDNADGNSEIVLNWRTRFNIMLGIARGLAYLHQDSQVCIIHRDIKPSNILLDDDLTPKIADFGLARLFSHDISHITTRAAGTLGYLCPEYAMRGQLTDKADVYSYGVLALEIVSGRRNADYSLSQEKQRLLDWAWNCYCEGEHWQLVDPRMSNMSPRTPLEEVIRVIHVALLCVQSSPLDRPSMTTVIQLLYGQTEILERPNMPPFFGTPTIATNHNNSEAGLVNNSQFNKGTIPLTREAHHNLVLGSGLVSNSEVVAR